jgi:protein gp37
MADNSKIEWTDATWNPITGCSVVSPGCTNCYAMRLAGTRLANHQSRAGLTRDTKAGPVWTGEVRFNDQWLDQPLRWKKPRMIFVCAHGDLFAENVPDAWIDRVFAVMALAPQHTFQVLTKRSARMRAYMGDPRRPYMIARRCLDLVIANPKTHGRLMDRASWPVASEGDPDDPSDVTLKAWPLPNVWLGVSVEDQKRADERIPDLLATPAAIRWISAEPLLGPINFRWALWDNWRDQNGNERPRVNEYDGLRMLDWIVAGGESGPGARPMHPDWARSLRDQCAAAGVPFHFKQWGEWSPHVAAIEDERGSIRTTPRGGVNWQTEKPGGAFGVFRVGKARAGRLLDGVEHNGLPEARS